MTEALGKPTITRTVTGYRVWFEDYRLSANVDRLTSDRHCEITVRQELENQAPTFINSARLNLMAIRSLSEFTTSLERNTMNGHSTVFWRDFMNLTKLAVLTEDDKGEAPIAIGAKKPQTGIEWQLRPILQKGQPTTLFAPGGRGKGFFAGYVASLIQFNYPGIESKQTPSGHWFPLQTNVLYLDWEADVPTFERRLFAIKQGLGMSEDNEETILYRACKRTLADDFSIVRKIITDREVGFLVVDSQMPAAGSGPDQAMLATIYYNCLREFGITSLTIDHTTKAEAENDNSDAPINTVVKFNRARAVFRLIASPHPGEPYLDLSLKQTKSNNTIPIKPEGIKIDFANDREGNLLRAAFTSLDLQSDERLAKTSTIEDRIVAQLENYGGQTVPELAEALDKGKESVRTVLRRGQEKKPPKFHQNGNIWTVC